MQQITGNFKQCIFKSSSYVVGLFKVKDTSSDIVRLKNKTITFTGYFDSLNEHDLYTFYGNIVIHDRYGEQFQVDSYEIVLPKEKDKIIDFLSSNLFHKIGKRKASKIVEVLGEDALKVILENKDSLWLVPTLTKENIDTIYEALSKYRNSYEVIVNLTKIGFSMKEALRVYKEYKANTMDIINTDPYTLVRDIKEITFTRVDKLRSKFDIKDDDSRRIDAGIVYAINEVNQNIGNSYLSYDEVIYYTNRALNINNSDLIMEGINRLLDLDILVLDDNNILLKEMYVALENIAKRVVDLTKSKSNVKVSSSDIKDLERLYNINYNKEQFNAICGAIENNIMIITGGPGVGKTTVIKGICSLYQNIYKIDFRTFVNEVALLAPTGRACKRIQEQTNFPASTIHRFLKWNKDEDTFLVNESNKSDVKLVIIDEVSMLDIYLFHNLLLGLRPMTKIILIGDYNPTALLKEEFYEKISNIKRFN